MEKAIDGLKINYQVFGDKNGVPLLILHGWGIGAGGWEKTAKLLAEKNIMVITVDLPGFGKSDCPKNVWGVNEYVEFIKQFSDNFSEFKNGFFLLGHSFGGGVATKFSMKYPQRIKKLFLVAPALVRRKKTINTAFVKFSKFVKIFSFLPFYQNFRNFFYKRLIRKTDYLNSPGIMKKIFSKIISEDIFCTLTFLETKTIIFWGNKDKLTPIGESKITKEKIKNSNLLVFNGVGHNLHREMPEILAEKILENL